ncbi:hypothetical protein TNCV_1403091 [Trichonephila clavipes]|nr:hypothetical protein TNCV_1403091 [Trichonephila clavipes]
MQENQWPPQCLLAHCEKPSNRLDSQDMVLRFDVNSAARSKIIISTAIRISLNGVNWVPSAMISHGANASRRPALSPLIAEDPKLPSYQVLQPCADIRIMAQFPVLSND